MPIFDVPIIAVAASAYEQSAYAPLFAREQIAPAEHPLDVMASAFLDARDRHGDERAAMAEALGVLALTELRTPHVSGPSRQARRISAKRERAFRATLSALIGDHICPRTEALSL